MSDHSYPITLLFDGLEALMRRQAEGNHITVTCHPMYQLPNGDMRLAEQGEKVESYTVIVKCEDPEFRNVVEFEDLSKEESLSVSGALDTLFGVETQFL